MRRLPADRQKAFRLGLTAESRAAAYLVARGYRILARRYRTRAGEIDIVAMHGRLLVFCEVKARARLDDAAEAVGARNRQRVVAAAQAWLAANRADMNVDIRFDVVLVAPGHAPRHLPGAFDATE
ncbi:MAG: YraN family protein [Proteobacteria bacterium]|nr:YraN family protein [Pseudomonadota bacterium]